MQDGGVRLRCHCLEDAFLRWKMISSPSGGRSSSVGVFHRLYIPQERILLGDEMRDEIGAPGDNDSLTASIATKRGSITVVSAGDPEDHPSDTEGL
jgi:hypothetical protein